MFRRQLMQLLVTMAGANSVIPPPPDRPGLGSTFKRPVPQITVPSGASDTDARIVIGGPLPPPLDTYNFFAANGPLADAGIIFYQAGPGNVYNFIVHVSSGSGTFVWIGAVKGGAVVESSPHNPAGTQWSISTPGVGASIVQYLGGNDFFDVVYANPAGVFTGQPRGLVLFERLTANIPQAGSTGEQILYTTAQAYTFTNARAYRLKIVGQMNSTAIQRVRYRIREGASLLGQILILWPNLPIDAASTDVPVNLEGIFINASGVDVTTKLSITTQATTATAINFDGQNAPTQTYIHVEDLGDIAIYTGVSM